MGDRLSLPEIQRRRGLNRITTRDLLARSMQAIQVSWATSERAERVLGGDESQNVQRLLDETAAELVDLVRRGAQLHDDGSVLTAIAGQLRAPGSTGPKTTHQSGIGR
jgi:hypothetical protein